MFERIRMARACALALVAACAVALAAQAADPSRSHRRRQHQHRDGRGAPAAAGHRRGAGRGRDRAAQAARRLQVRRRAHRGEGDRRRQPRAAAPVRPHRGQDDRARSVAGAGGGRRGARRRPLLLRSPSARCAPAAPACGARRWHGPPSARACRCAAARVRLAPGFAANGPCAWPRPWPSWHSSRVLHAVAAEPPAPRVVSMNPSLTAILVALDARSMLVGVDEYSARQQPEVAALPTVGGLFNPSLEAVVALEPDLVVLVPSAQQRDLRSRLEALGIEVLVLPNISRGGPGLDRGARSARWGAPRRRASASRRSAAPGARRSGLRRSGARVRAVVVLQRDPLYRGRRRQLPRRDARAPPAPTTSPRRSRSPTPAWRSSG